METRILFIKDVARLMGLSVPSVNKLLRLARAGKPTMPLPISPPNSKGRWLASDVEDFLQSQSTRNCITPPNVSPVKQVKREQRDWDKHQAEIKRRLQEHAAGRKVKG